MARNNSNRNVVHTFHALHAILRCTAVSKPGYQTNNEHFRDRYCFLVVLFIVFQKSHLFIYICYVVLFGVVTRQPHWASTNRHIVRQIVTGSIQIHQKQYFNAQ